MSTALARTFVLHTADHAAAMLAFVKANAAAMAKQGQPLEVRVSVHKAKRSSEQNALMWVLLTAIADQAWVAGRQFDAEVWHEHLKRELLPEETARGVAKWRYLPSGDRVLAMSTTDLDVSEFSTYVEKLQAKAAVELGVIFNDY
jgi:hypothetical protein